MIQRLGRGVLISMLFIQQAVGQTDSLNIATPYVFTVEEDVLNLKVQSTESQKAYGASRSNENALETVTSTYIITAEEIKQAGAISWGEALRLAPGLLVKQKTNGYYDISLHGTSGEAYYQAGGISESASFLLTINGIPLNNFFQGDIFWEAIPVELDDVQQIEIVTSPHTAFFGPNAATGLINLVTKRVEEKSLRAKASLQGSINEDYSHRGNASFGISDQLKFRVAAHYNRLTRFQDEFYLLDEQRYIQSDSLLYYQANARATNESSEKSLRNHGVNVFTTYQPNAQVSIEAMVSTNESYLQSVLQPVDRIALTNRHLKTNMFSLRTRLYNIRTNIAYQSGEHNLAVGYDGFNMRMGSLFGSIEYDYSSRFYQVKVGGDVQYNTFRNVLSQQQASLLTTSDYADRIMLGTNRMHSTGLLVSQNVYLLNKKWRWLATARADRLSITNQLYGSYQLGSTYKIGKVHLLRAVAAYGLGNFSAQNYLTYDQTTSRYEANENLKPLSVQSYEAGYRVTPYNDILLDLSYFRKQSSNFVDLSEEVAGERVNSELATLQQGMTIHLQGSANKLEASAFFTVQNTEVIAGSLVRTDSSVPDYFGGLTGSYRTFLNKLRFNVGLYYYSSSRWGGPETYYELPGKLITNCKISYNVWDEHVLFFNGRNLLNNKNIESPFADQVKSMYMVGVDLVF